VLELCRNELGVIPASVMSMTWLRKLDVYGTGLESMPRGMEHFAKLETLVCGWNRLQTLPEALLELPCLTNLDIWGGSQLESCPPWLGRLEPLTSLDLHANELTSVPESIGSLQNLLTLKLSVNKLHELPTEIGGLARLEHLDAHGNMLTTLPGSIGQLASLRSLLLKANSIESLPEEIGSLHNLIECDLTQNRLRLLPAGIALPRLARLYLANNELVTLPHELSRTALTLRQLSLGRNPLQVPPLDVCAEGLREVLSYLAGLSSPAGATYKRTVQSLGASSIFEVNIPRASTVEGGGGNSLGTSPHTVYEVQIQTTAAGWSVFRRFSEFCDLHAAISSQHCLVRLPALPSAWDPVGALFGTKGLDAALVEERRGRLEHMIQELLKLSEAISMDLLLPFLELESVWRACHYGDVAHMSFLASHGFDVTETDEEGRTPLHLVASTGNIEMAKVLLKHGAPATLEDNGRRTPLQCAEAAGHRGMARLLQASINGEDIGVSSPRSPGSSGGVLLAQEEATAADSSSLERFASEEQEAHRSVTECAAEFAFVEADV